MRFAEVGNETHGEVGAVCENHEYGSVRPGGRKSPRVLESNRLWTCFWQLPTSTLAHGTNPLHRQISHQKTQIPGQGRPIAGDQIACIGFHSALTNASSFEVADTWLYSSPPIRRDPSLRSGHGPGHLPLEPRQKSADAIVTA